MSLCSNTKIYQKFNNPSLLDQVSGLPMAIGGTNQVPLLLPSGGYEMAQDQYLYMESVGLGISNQFTLPFWLYPSNQGIAQNPVSKAFANLQMPLIVIGQGTFDTGTQEYNITNHQINIYELCLENGLNQMVVVLNGVYTATSSTYEAGLWHYFWIAWNGNTLTFEIFIDGILSSLTTSGTLPQIILASTAGFWINPQSISPAYNVLRNTGILDDVAVLNIFMDDSTSIQKATSLSLDYVLDSVLSTYIESDLPILFDDPTAVKVTDMVDDGSYLFATRTDGVLLQGSPLLWATRKDYNNPNEASALNAFGTGATISGGYLQITNGTVKL